MAVKFTGVSGFWQGPPPSRGVGYTRAPDFLSLMRCTSRNIPDAVTNPVLREIGMSVLCNWRTL